MNLVPCEYKTHAGSCSIATTLSGRTVTPWENVCEACVSCEAPKQENFVTASISCHVWEREGDRETAARVRAELNTKGLFQIGRRVKPRPCGPGCHLERIITSLGVNHTGGCGCEELAAEMDRNGCQWCRDNLDYIVDRLVATLEKRLAAEDAGELKTEPYEYDAKIPWWIRQGYKLPGAARMIGKRIVLLAVDRAEAESVALKSNDSRHD